MKYRFCRIFIEKKYLYRVLNGCRKLTIRNINAGRDETSFEISFTEIEELKKYMNAENIPILREENFGFFRLLRFNKLKVFLTATLLTIIILYINSLYIWNISVVGNYSYTESKITSFIHKNNCKEGMLKSKIDCEQIENKMRSKFNDISWVSCEIKGTNLIIHIKENYISEISLLEDKPYDIISNVSGKIESIITRSGIANVKAGDHVKKNDLLVSGRVDVLNEVDEKIFSSYCNADADIMAKVVHNYSDSLKKEYDIVNMERKNTYYLPTLNNYNWKLSNPKKKFIEKSNIKLKLYDNYYLPLSINKIVVYKDKPIRQKRSKKQAEDILMHKMLYKFVLLEQKGYKILEKDVKIIENEKHFILKGKFTCIEPIGKIKYIDMEKETEGESKTQ